MTGPASGRPVFPASLRLRRAADYNRVFQRSRRSHDQYFTVLARRNHLDSARLGLAIAKKSCKSAVGRNRLKRIVRESFRQSRAALPNVDLVVLSKPAAASADADRLGTSLAHHWQKVIASCAR